MHLLNASQATTDDDGEAVDLGQSPGDIVYISAADTELRSLAAAQAARPPGSPSLRLANMLRLAHPMSVDLYVEEIVAKAKLVILRLLGGRSYWPYGLEQIAFACREKGIGLAVLPGDDQPDQELAGWCTLSPEACHRLWQYGIHGGIANSAALLRYAATLLGRDEPWTEPSPLLRAGIYWPGETTPDLDLLREKHWSTDRPTAAIVFYRPWVSGGGPRCYRCADQRAQPCRAEPSATLRHQSQGQERCLSDGKASGRCRRRPGTECDGLCDFQPQHAWTDAA